MADRTVHYEAAFEAFLREKGIPCVAVDEAKKALFANAKLKSFDFVVYSKAGPNLLVDVKGRQLRNRSSRRGFETWTTEQDVADLMQWQEVFGQGYKAVLTFVYWIDPPLTAGAGHVPVQGAVVPAAGGRPGRVPQPHAAAARPSGRRCACPAEDFRSLARPDRKLVMIVGVCTRLKTRPARCRH